MKIETFKIIGIDPGSNLGISVFTISTDKLEIVKIETFTTTITDVTNPNNCNDNGVYRLSKIYNRMTEILKTHKPHSVAIEAAFMSRFPKAFGVLTGIISMLSLAVVHYDKHIRITKVSPLEGKSAVGSCGTKKEDILEAMLKIKELTKHVKLKNVNEHVVDSVAIGYFLLLKYRKHPALLIQN